MDSSHTTLSNQHPLMMSFGRHFFVGDVKHLEKQTQVLDEIGVVIVVDGEPKHGVGYRIDVSHLPGRSSTGNENGRTKGSGTFRRHQTQVVVAFGVGIFQFVQILHVINAQIVHFLFQVLGHKVGDVIFLDFAVTVGGNQVIGAAESKEFAQTKGHALFFLVTATGKSTDGYRGSWSQTPTRGLWDTSGNEE